jgi:hypothetical protein
VRPIASSPRSPIRRRRRHAQPPPGASMQTSPGAKTAAQVRRRPEPREKRRQGGPTTSAKNRPFSILCHRGSRSPTVFTGLLTLPASSRSGLGRRRAASSSDSS